MQKINKKGLSDTVATLLIIFLSVIAVILVASYVNKLVKSPSLSPEMSCFNLQLNTPIIIDNACYNLSTKDAEVTLKRSSDEMPIESLDFALSSNYSSSNWHCGRECQNCKLLDYGKKTYYFNSENKPNLIILKINNCVAESKEIKEC